MPGITEHWSPAIRTVRYEVSLTTMPEFIHGQSKYRATHVTLHYRWTNDNDMNVFWTLYVNQIRAGRVSPRLGKLLPSDFRGFGKPVPEWLDDIVDRGKPRLG